MDANNFSPNVASNFYCENCDYVCSKTSDMNKHIMTRKHKVSKDANINANKTRQKSPKTIQENKCFDCNCGKTFKHLSSLSRHKKMCNQIVTFDSENKIISENSDFCLTKEMFLELMKTNHELQKQIIDLCKNNSIISNSNNITTNNSHNKTFNLQVFLNETCKNAMNIMDFVDSLQLQLSDLESVGKLGFVDGISNIIIKNLKALDVTMRPVHCSDTKRESMYVKDNDKWEKDDELNTKLRKAIKYIAHKNTKLIPQWKAKYPDYMDASSIQSDQYNDLIIEVLGGDTNLHSSVNENKIIKKIAKEVTIDKKLLFETT